MIPDKVMEAAISLTDRGFTHILTNNNLRRYFYIIDENNRYITIEYHMNVFIVGVDIDISNGPSLLSYPTDGNWKIFPIIFSLENV